MPVKRTALGKRKRGARVAPMTSKKLQSQVRQLMRMRQEKKYADVTATGAVAQANGSAAGALVSAITPTIAQGDGEGQRIGNSITATGLVVKQQFMKQQFTATGLVVKQQFMKQQFGIGPRRVRTHIVRVLDPGMSTAEVLAATFDTNPLSGVVDYFSSLNYTMMRDKRVQLLGSADAKLMSNYDDNMTSANERSTAELTVPVKFDDQTIRYSADGDSAPASIRYFTITLCDQGNSSGGTSGLSIFIPNATSGVESKLYARLWYTDA